MTREEMRLLFGIAPKDTAQAERARLKRFGVNPEPAPKEHMPGYWVRTPEMQEFHDQIQASRERLRERLTRYHTALGAPPQKTRSATSMPSTGTSTDSAGDPSDCRDAEGKEHSDGR